MKKSRLTKDHNTPPYQQWNEKELTDIIGFYASEIENSLIDNGAKPNEDYEYLDLYKLAEPLVIEHLKVNNLFKFVR